MQSGKMSYYTFVAAFFLAVGWWYALPPFPQVSRTIAQWCPYPNLIIGSLYASVGFLVWGWSKRVDGRMESMAQDHWQRHRQALRKILADSWSNHSSQTSEKGFLRETRAG